MEKGAHRSQKDFVKMTRKCDLRSKRALDFKSTQLTCRSLFGTSFKGLALEYILGIEKENKKLQNAKDYYNDFICIAVCKSGKFCKYFVFPEAERPGW